MKEIIKKINKFRDDRNWRQFHNEKDLAISISLESSECTFVNDVRQKKLKINT